MDDILLIGDEDLNEDACYLIDEVLAMSEAEIIAMAGFDFESKVIAVTDRNVLIVHENDGVVLNSYYSAIPDTAEGVKREGRTLIIKPAWNQEPRRFQFGNDRTVIELVNIINEQRRTVRDKGKQTGEGANPGGSEARPAQRPPNPGNGGTPASIAERVKFWEEQDRINQELIPRVIKQDEVLTSHIRSHENLQATAVRMVRETVEEAEGRIGEQLQAARDERQAQAAQWEAMAWERESLVQQLQQAEEQIEAAGKQLEAATAEREEMKTQHAGEVASLRANNRWLTILAWAAIALAGTAVALAVLL